MVEHVTDPEGRVIAYMEWSLVNDKGVLDDNGTYVFVRELWIWSGVKHGIYIIKSFINKIADEFPKATHGYWKRKKHNNRIKVFTRKELYGE